MWPVFIWVVSFGLTLRCVESNGTFMLKNMDFFAVLANRSESDPISIESKLCIGCLCFGVVVGVIWLLWEETKATTNFWKSSYIFHRDDRDQDDQIVKDLPERNVPKKLDRRSSSIAKSSMDASNQV